MIIIITKNRLYINQCSVLSNKYNKENKKNQLYTWSST